MGVLSGAIRCAKFNVGDLSNAGPKAIQESLKFGAFKELMPLQAESRGWVEIGDFSSCEFESTEDFWFGSTVSFLYRTDKKTVSSKLLALRLAQVVKKWNAENNMDACPKSVKVSLREALQAELLRTAHPKISTSGITIDMRTGDMLVHASGSRLEEIQDFVKKTFEYNLEQKTVLDEISDEVVARLSNFGSFGHEFNLWLWLKAQSNLSVEIGKGDHITVWVDGSIKFKALNSQKVTTSIAGDFAADSDPTLAALSADEAIEAITIGFHRGDESVGYSVTMSDSDIVKIKPPRLVKSDDQEDDLEVKVWHQEHSHSEASHVISGLIELFAYDYLNRWAEIEKEVTAIVEATR